ncbi:P-loop containing nucleoside triphosphate hydrolase protein [Earliella scabrosa]|nr:P-loop containing nucleoside triphosphate hydrolase protein [Earliella scabrosa]
MDSLHFLVRHRFVAATYKINITERLIFVRVYVIPWDLPGSKGALRSRDEDTVLRPGRRRLKALFLLIKQDKSLWDGDTASGSTPNADGVLQDNRSLLDIYNDLPSPNPEGLIEDIPGLGSTLYGYQRRTVSSMAAREAFRGSVPDPLYLPIKGMDGKTFYILPATMEIVSECPRISSVRGGILCEELGTGKTVMMLSLILATLDQLSSPEEAFHEQRTPMTPVALRHFQTPDAIAERSKLAKDKVLRNTGIPSLVELMLHRCRVQPETLALRENQEQLKQQNLWRPLRANVPFYLSTDPPKDVGYGAARGSSGSAPRVMYLTTATLVVVPDNLELQWHNEINKHTTGGILRVLTVQKKELPSAPKLATDYDVILMSHSRFAKEAKDREVERLLTRTPCQCDPIQGSRVPRCKCSRRDKVSPLLQIRWKRLVVDEGHNAAETRTDYAIFTKLLSVERRWIMTGTPTSKLSLLSLVFCPCIRRASHLSCMLAANLLGLNFGSGSELQYPEDDNGDTSMDTSIGELSQQRRWQSDERSDFVKLGKMFAEFLLMMPFASDPKAFAALVSSPIFSADGPWPGDIQVLTQVMSSVMIRHRIEDVEQDVRLPFLEHDTVLLDLDPYAVKTYNLIQATIAVNAVDSERKDQDYLFHPRNAASLQELVANISHVMFWHVADPDLHERLANAQRCLENLSKREGSREDFELIKESILHIRSAMDDPIWNALQTHYHAHHRVEKLPESVYRAWNMFPESAQEAARAEWLMPTASLIKLHDYLSKHFSKNIHDLVEMGHTFTEEERKWKELEALELRLKKGSRHQRRKDELAKNSFGSLKRDKATQRLEEMRQEYRLAAERLNTASGGGPVPPPRPGAPAQRSIAASVLRHNPVSQARIKNSTSTKLDYILSEVLQYHADEKFLIFSGSPSTLSFIGEALELIKVEYLMFNGKRTREERQTMVTTFETSDKYRVLLMELKHGARGLNLVSASRVIFCEPVWKADVESQAIKRVHRIGQSRRVIVKTLAIRGTSEEAMVKRSKELKDEKQEFTKEMTDDRNIRDFIERPQFLPISTNRLVNLDVPLFDLPPPPVPLVGNGSGKVNVESSSSSAPRTSIVRFATPPLPRRHSAYVEITTEPPRKKQKTVSFA